MKPLGLFTLLLLFIFYSCKENRVTEEVTFDKSSVLKLEIERLRQKVDEDGRPAISEKWLYHAQKVNELRKPEKKAEYKSALMDLKHKIEESDESIKIKNLQLSEQHSMQDLMFSEAMILGRINHIIQSNDFDIDILTPVIKTVPSNNAGSIYFKAGQIAYLYLAKIKIENRLTGNIVDEIDLRSNRNNEIVFDFRKYDDSKYKIYGSVSVMHNNKNTDFPIVIQ